MASHEVSERTVQRFAVARITQCGETQLIQVEQPLEFLQMAKTLRCYLAQGEDAPTQFADRFPQRSAITQAQFDAVASQRLSNTGQVAGAYDIDLDKGEFCGLHIMDGWQVFHIQDVSAAVDHAEGLDPEEQWRQFLEHLDGKQLTAYQAQDEPRQTAPTM